MHLVCLPVCVHFYTGKYSLYALKFIYILLLSDIGWGTLKMVYIELMFRQQSFQKLSHTLWLIARKILKPIYHIYIALNQARESSAFLLNANLMIHISYYLHVFLISFMYFASFMRFSFIKFAQDLV